MTLIRTATERRTTGSIGGFLAGLPVSASDWSDLSAEQRWLLAQGRQLVPAFRPYNATVNKTTLYRFAFRIVPTLHAIQRVWAVTTRATSGATFTVEGVSRAIASSPTFVASRSADHAVPSLLIINVSTQTSAESSVDLDLDISENGVVDCISCVEIPRLYLDDGATEDAANPNDVRTGQPITATSLAKFSETHLDTSFGKRVHLHWAVPYQVASSLSTTFARTSASTTYVDILDVAAPILGRTLYSGDTARTVTCKVFGWTTSTAVAQGRATSTSGAGSVTALSLTNTPGWSDAFTVDVDAEDLAEADGLPSSTWDDIQVAFRRSSGAGSVYVTSAIVYEA